MKVCKCGSLHFIRFEIRYSVCDTCGQNKAFNNILNAEILYRFMQIELNAHTHTHYIRIVAVCSGHFNYFHIQNTYLIWRNKAIVETIVQNINWYATMHIWGSGDLRASESGPEPTFDIPNERRSFEYCGEFRKIANTYFTASTLVRRSRRVDSHEVQVGLVCLCCYFSCHST